MQIESACFQTIECSCPPLGLPFCVIYARVGRCLAPAIQARARHLVYPHCVVPEVLRGEDLGAR